MNQVTIPDRVIELEAVPPGSFRLWLVLLVGLAVAMAWAAIGELDVVSPAQGVVIPASKVQVVQHLEGGIVQELLVREGEQVSAGQPLVILESTGSGAEFGELMTRLQSLQAELWRLEAEAAAQSEIEFEAGFARENPDLVEKTQSLFHARREKLATANATQQQEIAQREQDIAEVSARIGKNRSRLALAREQVAIGNKLIANELSNRYEQIERLKEVTALESRIDEDAAVLKRTTAGLEQARSRLANVNDEYAEEVQTALVETRGKIADLQQRREKFKDNLARTVLKAPVDGVVKTLHVVTVGGVVPPGGTLLELVPGADRLIVEARLPPQEVGYLQVGQPAFVQLAGLDANRLGKIFGTVERISPDTLVTEEGLSFYLVRIGLQRSHFGAGELRYELHPGVLVTVGIVTGRRTVLEYLLAPLSRDLAFNFSER